MITLEQDMTVKDIRQWLSNGWFLYKGLEYKGYVPAQILHYPAWDDSIAPLNLLFAIKTANGTIEHRRYEDLPNCVFPHWPILGAINLETEKIALRISRLQQKQWCRTYQSDYLSIFIPKLRALMAKGEVLIPNYGTGAFVTAVFAPEYPNASELKQRFMLNWRSVAVSPQVIVTNTTPICIYFRDELAATVRNHKLVPVNPRLFKRIEKVISEGDLPL